MSVHLLVVICTTHSKVITVVMPVNVDLLVQKPQIFLYVYTKIAYMNYVSQLA